MENVTIREGIERFIENIGLARSENTEHTYQNAMNAFSLCLEEMGNDPGTQYVSELSERDIADFAKYLKVYAPTTEALYINVVRSFYEFLMAEKLADFNIYQTKTLIKNRTRKQGVRFPQFSKPDIEKVLEYVDSLAGVSCESETDRLIALRDRALLITLADTGLRIHEACALRRGTVDWFNHRAVIIGKGNKQAMIRFSNRSMDALKVYLAERGCLDGSSGRQLASLPLFARHDKGAGKNILPISTKTGREIVSQRVRECLGEQAVGSITPHSFRHYFVTNVLQQTGNLKIAQTFARHSSITVTQRYAHLSDNELDETYYDIFDRDQDMKTNFSE